MDFNMKILVLRKERNMTQEELAEKAGISRQYLSNIERGVQKPTTDVLNKIFSILSPSGFEQISPQDDYKNANVDMAMHFFKDVSSVIVPLIVDPLDIFKSPISPIPVNLLDAVRFSIPRNFAVNDNMYAILIENDSMEPEIFTGDIIFVTKKQPFTNFDGGIGLIKYTSVPKPLDSQVTYKIQRNPEGALLRRIFKVKYDGIESYLLEAANPMYPKEIIPVSDSQICRIVTLYTTGRGKF